MPLNRGDFKVRVVNGATLLEEIDWFDLSERSSRTIIMKILLDAGLVTDPYTYDIVDGKDITPIKGRRLVDEKDGGEPS